MWKIRKILFQHLLEKQKQDRGENMIEVIRPWENELFDFIGRYDRFEDRMD